MSDRLKTWKPAVKSRESIWLCSAECFSPTAWTFPLLWLLQVQERCDMVVKTSGFFPVNCHFTFLFPSPFIDFLFFLFLNYTYLLFFFDFIFSNLLYLLKHAWCKNRGHRFSHITISFMPDVLEWVGLSVFFALKLSKIKVFSISWPRGIIWLHFRMIDRDGRCFIGPVSQDTKIVNRTQANKAQM